MIGWKQQERNVKQGREGTASSLMRTYEKCAHEQDRVLYNKAWLLKQDKAWFACLFALLEVIQRSLSG